EKRLHLSAVSLRDISDYQFDRILQGERINQFAAGRRLYRIVRRREYGPGAVSTRGTQTGRGRCGTEPPDDGPERTGAEGQIVELDGQGRSLTELRNNKAARLRELEDERKQIDSKVVCSPGKEVPRLKGLGLSLTFPRRMSCRKPKISSRENTRDGRDCRLR